VRRRGLALALAVAAAALPGCIAVIGDKESSAGTPNDRALTDLEKRMDRVDERLPKTAQ
jgi:uncharacterized protein YceK